jgi:hypothetical protein
MREKIKNLAEWSTAYINNLPDSSFAYIKPGEKDSSGKTTPRSNRYLPYKGPDGKTIDPPHLRNALSRLPQVKGVPSGVLAAAKKELEAALKKANTKESVENLSAEEIIGKIDISEGWTDLEGETFEESFACDLGEATYDESSHVAKNIQILGPVSKNNRRYPASVQKEAIPLFEGSKAYLNHQPPNQMREARRVEDMIGHYQNVAVSNDGKMTGDLHLIPDKKVVKEHVIPILKDKNASKLVGNSIVARGQMSKGSDGVYDVEKIIGVRSVDMVSEPATTSGMFSENLTEGISTEEHDMALDLKALTFDQLKESRPDLLEAFQAQKSQDEEVKQLKAKLVDTEQKLVEADKKNAESDQRELKRERDAKVETAIREAKLPDAFRYEKDSTVIKSHVRSIVERCASDEEMAKLIEDWESSFADIKVPVVVKAEEKPISREKKVLTETAEVDDKAIDSLYEAIAA